MSACGVGSEGLFVAVDGGSDSSADGSGASGGDGSMSGSSDGGDWDGRDAPFVVAAAFDDGAPSASEGGQGTLDAGVVCPGATLSPCIDPDTANNDFCSDGSRCGPCTEVVDDTSCTTAYGSKVSSQFTSMSPPGPYLCLAGACSPGDCRTDGDCTTNPRGTICGATAPNLCGRCTTDTQCANSGPMVSVCDTTTGQCAAGACAPNAGNPPATCPVNPSDICCTGVCQASAGANTCCPGPGANAYCATLLGNNAAACIGTLCTACPPVTGTTYSVDPVRGSDQAGTGNSGVAGCAFKTITRALQVVDQSGPLATAIAVLGPSTVDPGETFPLVVPANVTITTSGGPVTVNVPAAQSGVLLATASSGIGGGPGAPLTINGQSGKATHGIVASTGSQTTTRIANVTVMGFLDDGILVDQTGMLFIGPGVVSTANGTAALRRSGLHVTGSGHAVIDVPLGSAPTHFDANTNHGILVDGSGYVTLTGVVTSATAGAGTVTTNANYGAGLRITQTPGTPPENAITGLVSFGGLTANGMLLMGGSNVKVRQSVALNNQGNGVFVFGTLGTGSNDISRIDLGNPAGLDYGNNTFQAPLGSGNNGSAGICLDALADAGTLLAAGNVFGAANCAAMPAKLTISHGSSSCTKGTCSGRACDLGILGSGNDIDVTMCTHP